MEPTSSTSVPEPSEDLLDAVVIGGGQAGLAIAWHLAQQKARFVVLDAGPQVGHVWRSRWDSLRLFTPAQYDSLPGMPFPAAQDAYPTKDQVADYLQEYVSRFDLPVRLGTTVTRLTQAGGQFRIETDHGQYAARQVVVATGAFQAPLVPPLAGGLDDDIVQLHSSQYRGPEQLPDVPVLVVGAGNSGLQIAEELAATRRVTVAVGSRNLMLPQRLLGHDLFWWLSRTGLVSKSADSRLARRVQARGELVIGGSWKRLQRKGVAVRPRVVAARGRTVEFADTTTEDVGAVVWATGFRPDYPWIDVPGVVTNGTVVHTAGVTGVPGLFFLGLPWQRSRGSSLLGFVERDAAWLAERLAARRNSSPERHGRTPVAR